MLNKRILTVSFAIITIGLHAMETDQKRPAIDYGATASSPLLNLSSSSSSSSSSGPTHMSMDVSMDEALMRGILTAAQSNMKARDCYGSLIDQTALGAINALNKNSN